MSILKLVPAFKDYLWGGEKLKTDYHKNTTLVPLAESWELSYHKDGLTRLENGKTLQESLPKEALGKNATAFEFFPVLTKFIDAKDNLSVQVHPSDEYALKYENSYGKTEMWYIVEAEEGAGLYLGFNRDVKKEEFEKAIKENTLTELMNFIPVHAGETYFIPSGTLHAIGKGCLIYEIQQNSNLTYRVYDFGRLGKDGKPRELHIEKALKVTRLEKFQPTVFENVLGQCKYFTAEKFDVDGERTLPVNPDSFTLLTCIDGGVVAENVELKKGDSALVPAGESAKLLGHAKLISVRV